MDHDAVWALFAVVWVVGWTVPGAEREASNQKRGAPQWVPWLVSLGLSVAFGVLTRDPESFLEAFGILGVSGWLGWFWGGFLAHHSINLHRK